MVSSIIRKKLFFPVFIALLIYTYSWGQTTGRITGKVYEETTLTPIPNVFVICYDYASDEYITEGIGVTQDDGSYVLDVPPGNYRVTVKLDSNASPSILIPEFYDNEIHAYYADKVSVSADQTLNNINFALSVGGVIAGTILDQNQNPIVYAKIEAYDRNGTFKGYAHSIEGGQYYLHVPEGEYKILASKDYDDYVSTFYPDVSLLANAETIVVNNEQIHDGYDFYLTKGIQVLGVVSNLSNNAISNVRIWAFQLTSTGIGYQYWTDVEDGNFSLLMPSGSYIFYAENLGNDYMNQFYDNVYDMIFATPINIENGAEIPSIDFKLPLPGWITGTVKSNWNRTDLENIQVIALKWENRIMVNSARTDANGRYWFELPPGQYLLLIDDSTMSYAIQFFNQVTQIEMAEPLTVLASQTILSADFNLVHMPDLIIMIQCITNHSFQNIPLEPMDMDQNNRIDMKDVIHFFQLISDH